MHRLFTLPLLALLLVLSGCGSGPENNPVSSNIPDRPTAFTLPTASSTTEPLVPADTPANPSMTSVPATVIDIVDPTTTTGMIDPTTPVQTPLQSALKPTTARIEPSPMKASAPPTVMSIPPTATSAPPAGTLAAPTATLAPPTATEAPTARPTNTAQPTAVATTAVPTTVPTTALLATATSAATPTPDIGAAEVTPTPTPDIGAAEVTPTPTPDIGAAELTPTPQPTTTLQIDQPAEGSLVVAPLHVAFGGARGDERLVLELIQANGAILRWEAQARRGYIVTTLHGNVVPGPATLEVAQPDGTVLARRMVRVAAPDETQIVKVGWIAPAAGEVVMIERRVVRTPQIASAALSEMLWGPDPGDTSAATSLPSADEVLTYGDYGSGWGARVRLLKLTITDGTAVVNLSPETHAYGGGSARAALIRAQIEATLRQFPSVKQVVVTINGAIEGVLEP